MNANERLALAHRMHEVILTQLRRLRASKIEVYCLLREFKRSKLYRLVDVPVAPRHARTLQRAGLGAARRTRGATLRQAEAAVCAERRFPTWEDYLASLGRHGISFGYFAELERLEARFGDEFVRLCVVGVPVETRRGLLRAPERTAESVLEVLASRQSDDEKVRSIQSAADAWQSEHDHAYPTQQTPHGRVSRYRRHAAAWERKLARLVDQAARVPCDFRRGPGYAKLARAWIDVFESHLVIGERLAREAFSPELGPPQMDVIREMRAVWERARVGRPPGARPPAA